MRVLVFGGRDLDDKLLVYWALDEFHAQIPITLLIHGAARGADTLGSCWAWERKVKAKAFPADWLRLRKAAGPIRNQQMIDEGRPEYAIKFPGGAGTADMLKRVKAAGIPCIEIGVDYEDSFEEFPRISAAGAAGAERHPGQADGQSNCSASQGMEAAKQSAADHQG